MKFPSELKPTEKDYAYFYEHYDMDKEETDYYYKEAWKDFIDFSVKEDFKRYKEEIKDEWRNEIENEGRENVPPFDEWHECIYDFIPNLEGYMEKNKDEIFLNFSLQYVYDIASPHDYFEFDDEGEDENE